MDPKKKKHASSISDQELLDTAIPIDSSELEGEEQDESSDPSQARTAKPVDELAPVDVLDDAHRPKKPRKIQRFGDGQRHAEVWTRTPNRTGRGAIHTKTFVGKMRIEALAHMDLQINEWLDAHPEYEVKFVSTAIGELREKITEPAFIVSVWV